MYLSYGSYSWDSGSVFIQTNVTTEFGQTGRPVSQTYTFSCRGTLTGTSQSDMKTKILAMEAALRVKNQNLVLYQDDASASAVLLMARGSMSGVQVIDGPSYPGTEGAENDLFRTWAATFRSTYPWGFFPDGTGSHELPDNYAITYDESLSISGGGAVYVHKPNVLGPWQKQLVYPQTPFVAVQSGTAVGLRGYPEIPPPIFPAALKETRPKVSRKGPRQEGYVLRDYTISWEYSFESVAPLVGLPHYWRSL